MKASYTDRTSLSNVNTDHIGPGDGLLVPREVADEEGGYSAEENSRA